jgi:hypothetical protein
MMTRTHSITVTIVVLALALSLNAKTNLGQPLTVPEATPIATIVDFPDKYVGRTLQVEGRITEVCEQMGCWMKLVDPASGKSLRIKVKDGEIVFPAEAIGKKALAEGKLQKLELSKDDAIARAKHEAEETGKPFDPASVTGPVTLYQLAGTGAVILD